MIPPWRNEKVRQIYGRPEIRASLEIVLSVFTVAGLLFFAVKPTLSTVAELQKKIEDQAAVNRRLDSKISQLVGAQRDLTTYATRLGEFEVAIPDAHDQGGLVKRIELLARETGLLINNLSLTGVPLVGLNINLAEKGAGRPQTEAEGKVAVFEATFDVSGSADQIFDFLTRLENMDRLVIISGVSMKREDLASETGGAVTPAVRTIGKLKGYYVLAPQP